MGEQGFIRDKLDAKYLILFILASLDCDTGFDDVLEATLVDGAITYFDISDAFFEMVESGHVEKRGEFFCISQKGRDVLAGFEGRLPASVRRDAQRAVLRAAARRKRDSLITCETRELSKNNYITSLGIKDNRGEIIKIDLMVVNSSQAAMLENNFKANAEVIYNEVLTALLKDYSGDNSEPR